MLDRLVGPTQSGTGFLDGAWPLAWAVFPGQPGRFPTLFAEPAIQSLEALLATGAPTELWWEDGGLKAAGAEPFSAARLYKRGGLTLRFMEADAYVPALKAVIDGLANDFGTPVGRRFANVYLSPPGMTTPRHFDAAEVFIAQIAGSKRWQVAANRSVESPAWGWAGGEPDAEERSQMAAPFPASVAEDAAEVILGPGDVLFLPRGCWHSSLAGEESISVSMAFECLTRLDVALAVIRQAALADPGWRRPAAGVTGETGRAALDTDLKQLGSKLAERGIDL